MKRITTLGAVIGLALGLVATIGGPASADIEAKHTPKGGADCTNGVWALGAGYEATDTNTITVTLDGETLSEEFAPGRYLSIPIPADGEEHAWAWSITTTNPDPSFSDSGAGTLTCDAPVVKRAAFRITKFCNGAMVASKRNVATVVKERPAPHRWVFTGYAKDGALFDNGRATLRKVVVIHRTCGGDS